LILAIARGATGRDETVRRTGAEAALWARIERWLAGLEGRRGERWARG